MAFVVLIAPLEVSPPVESVSFKIRMPRYGTLSIASYLKAHGHSVRVFDEFVGGEVDWNVVREADYVCFSVMSFCSLRAYQMAARAREMDKCIIFGGSHPSVLPEECLDHADFAVRNEGEETILELLDAIETHRPVSGIPGMSWRNELGQIVHNPDRAFMSDVTVPIDLSLFPDYAPWPLARKVQDAVVRGFPRFPMPVVQATRGCPFRCRFCFVKNELGVKYRRRPIEVILEEIGNYRRLFGTPSVLFADNDLTLDEEFSLELFGRIWDRFGRRFHAWLFSRLSVSGSPKLLALLNRFEHVIMGLGIESIDDTGLKDMKKGQTVSQVKESLNIMRRYDNLHVNGQFLFGTDTDTEESIRRTYQFGLDYGLYNLGMAIQYDFPGRNRILGQEQCIDDNHFLHRDWRFFGGNFAIHLPARMPPSVLQRTMLETFNRFYDHRSTFRQLQATRPSFLRYMDYIRTIEGEFYDKHGRRRDDRLEGRTPDTLAPLLPVTVAPHMRYVESVRYVAANVSRPKAWKMAWSALRPLTGKTIETSPGAGSTTILPTAAADTAR